MAGRRKTFSFRVTHSHVPDPDAVERGLHLWASYLAQHLSREIPAGPRKRRKDTA